MSSAALANPQHNYLEPTKTGASETAVQLFDTLSNAWTHLRAPISATPPSRSLQDEIISIFSERSRDNWDDQGAAALKQEALIDCLAFLNQYPSDLPLPEPIPEPDGAIALEWYVSSSRMFTISLAGDNRIAFAGKLGNGNRIHGTEEITGDMSPYILESIRRVSP